MEEIEGRKDRAGGDVYDVVHLTHEIGEINIDTVELKANETSIIDALRNEARVLSNKLKEQLADLSHQIWASWMLWVFKICLENEDGSVTIPVELVRRWKRQCYTDYKDLSEKEKDSDREQADKILSAIDEIKRQQTLDLMQDMLENASVSRHCLLCGHKLNRLC